ncbi:MAG: hypothetical protein P4L50_23410 [Anaerolineaceae bacterium]|nr:hypothetical protein [Anaerolineaceae bacterium]
MRNAVIATIFGASLIFCSHVVQADGWTSGFGQGFSEYTVKNGPGNQFTISCDVSESEKVGEKTSIEMMIVGKSPPPDSMVVVVLDGDEFQIQVDKFGSGNLDCHVCYDNFRAMWERLRTARTMLMQYADHRSSKFTMLGARKALSPKPCKTPFEVM